ncbi:opine metallophore biosynthesis dehydrogenase [Vibrio lentus]|uniref:opine metallophore biosynthesis dehydrogenase n=1 Tax=Vibrio lentus TaxID=136468 RepID=UPI001E554A23|nr:opine metallophore biosynthesis dehydrogenase [Vibrio lentus]MCC4836648.1 opine metallophore biosynthesis dehydrogenase [Vibrio lentus]
MNIQIVIFDSPFSVESRNAAAYVHPDFLIATFSLNHILSNKDDIKYMYKHSPKALSPWSWSKSYCVSLEINFSTTRTLLGGTNKLFQ